jgi:hypothetical protein
LAAIGGKVVAQRAAVPPAPPTGPGPRFHGTVLIAGLPADPGTTVQAVVFRAGRTFTVCGDGQVQVRTLGLTRPPPAPNTTEYDIALEPTPECLNPDNTFDFYVNGVYANASPKYPFSPGTQTVTIHVSVPELALKTEPTKTGVRLVWFYGQVKDRFGRSPPAGTTVTAKAKGASCSGTGKTLDLYWDPQFGGRHTFGVLGFYWIGVEQSPECVDRSLQFDIYAGGKPLKPASPRIATPRYGRAVKANLELP